MVFLYLIILSRCIYFNSHCLISSSFPIPRKKIILASIPNFGLLLYLIAKNGFFSFSSFLTFLYQQIIFFFSFFFLSIFLFILAWVLFIQVIIIIIIIIIMGYCLRCGEISAGDQCRKCRGRSVGK